MDEIFGDVEQEPPNREGARTCWTVHVTSFDMAGDQGRRGGRAVVHETELVEEVLMMPLA
jgi:hypothetical protein